MKKILFTTFLIPYYLLSFAQVITKLTDRIEIEDRSRYKMYNKYSIPKVEMPDVKDQIEKRKKEDEAKKTKAYSALGTAFRLT